MSSTDQRWLRYSGSRGYQFLTFSVHTDKHLTYIYIIYIFKLLRRNFNVNKFDQTLQRDDNGSSGVTRNFVRWGVQQIQLRTEDKENGDLGAVAP